MKPFLRFRAVSMGLPFVLSLLLSVLLVTGASADPGDVTLASTADGGTPKGGDDSLNQSLSADGRTVAFESIAMNLDPGDVDDDSDVYVKDLDTNELVLASSDGVTKGNLNSANASIALDGSRVAFDTFATNLLGEADTDAIADVYVKDLTSGGLTLASVTIGRVKGDGSSITPSLSSNGTIVAFSSFSSNLHPEDGDGTPDIYVKNLATGEVVLASRASDGTKGNGASFDPSLSADGTRVAFWSSANNLDGADMDTDADVYVRDLSTGVTMLASTSDASVKGVGASSAPSLSADGDHVAFESFASNLDPGDGDGLADVYVKDLASGDLVLASTSDGDTKGDGGSAGSSLSGDGASVAFQSNATNLDPLDTDPSSDVYVKDLQTGDITLASSPVSSRPSLSANGAFVAFESSSTTLDPADTDEFVDIYVRELGVAPITADLSVAVTDSPDPVGSGQLLTYVVTVTNHGGSDATEVALIDVIDDANLRSATTSQGSCVEDPRLGRVECSLGSLAVDGSATVEIVVRAVRPKNSPIENTATVSGAELDPVAGNNAASATTDIGTV